MPEVTCARLPRPRFSGASVRPFPPNPKYSGRGGRVACRSQMRGPERPWPEPELRAAGMRP